jgi:putative thioredoxin
VSDHPHIFHATQENFEADVLEASFETPVLVDFWAPWCSPCKQLMPMLDKVVREANGAVKLAKVNTDEEMAIAGSFGIRSLPTVVLIKDGRPVDGFMGLQPEGVVRALLAKHVVPKAAEPEPEPVDDGDVDLDAVIEALRVQVKAEPNKAELKAELADALLRAGQLAEATQLLDKLSSDAPSDAAKRALARLGFIQTVAEAPGEAELQAAIARDGHNLLARYHLGVRFLLGGDAAAGMDQFLVILKTDRKFNEDLGRRALLDAFKVVQDDELVGDYRRKMTSVLF